MNRVIIINLTGNAYQLEESGFDALRAYLDNAARRLAANPDKAEIVADIEQAIAEKFRAVLGPNKSVVITEEVEKVLTEMGPVQDANAESGGKSSATSDGDSNPKGRAQADPAGTGTSAESGPVKRLYAIREGAMFAGVCNGLGAYFNLDVTIVRILFVILGFFWGTGVLLYVVMAFIIPTATTADEKAAAHGAAHTAQEFIRRAKAGYYEGMKNFNDRDSRRAWKRKFKQDMQSWERNFKQQMSGHSNPWGYGGPGIALGRTLPWLINAVVAVFAVYALYSLVAMREVFGLPLPASVPLWVGIVSLIIIWHLIAAPFRMAGWGTCSSQGCTRGRCGPLGGLGDFLAGLCVAALIIWVLDRYVPAFHEMLKNLPPVLHQAIDSAQAWLDRR